VFYDGKRVEYRAQSDSKATFAEVRRELRRSAQRDDLYDEKGLKPVGCRFY
jgi:hypothetical protein